LVLYRRYDHSAFCSILHPGYIITLPFVWSVIGGFITRLFWVADHRPHFSSIHRVCATS
jgi:hypothetical protein